MQESTQAASTSRVRHWLPFVLLGCIAVLVLIGGWTRRHTIDDAFINYRIVHQIEAGNGPVFNAHERVEAYTSPMWLAMLVVGDEVLPIRLEWIGMLGGILLGAAGFVFAGLGSWRLQRNDARTRFVLPVGALALAVFPPTYRLIATGLEDGLTLAWLGACTWALGRWASRESSIGVLSAMLFGAGVLVRPDLAPFCAAFLVVTIFADRRISWRRRGGLIASAAAFPMVSQVFRMGYFGVLTPNTAIAKSASLSRWGMGWHYLLATFNPYWLWIPIVVIIATVYVPLISRGRSSPQGLRRALATISLGGASLICALYMIRVGGDYMQARLIMPAIFGFFAPAMFVEIRANERASVLIWGATIAAWIFVIGGFIRTPSDTRATLFESEHAVTLPQFQATFPGAFAPTTPPGSVTYEYTRLPYRSAAGETPIVVQLGIGKVAYALPNSVQLLDALGLANPIAAHERLIVRGWPGHEKLLSQPWIAALSTAPGSPVSQSNFPLPQSIHNATANVTFHSQDDPQGRPFAQRVATARNVLGCQRMVSFRASYRAPLTFSRFFENITSAWSNQHLVIPGEPADAAQHLCSATERTHFAP